MVLLKFVVRHLDDAEAWRSQKDVGIERNELVPYRIRDDMACVLPEGFIPFENDGNKGWRLSPKFDVEVVWDAVISHPLGAARQIAEDAKEKERRRR